MALDSVAEFARIKYLGLSEYMDKFDATDATTIGMFAFAANYSPNSADDSVVIKEVMVAILGSYTGPNKLNLRRQFFEAYSKATAEMQREADSRPSEAREVRRSRLEEQMPGFDFSDNPDPSNRSADLAYKGIESKTLQYLRWEVCTPRRMELDKITTDKAWTTGFSGCFKSLPVEILDHLSSAVVRRAFAHDMAGVMTFATSDVSRKMLLTRMRNAALPGYAKIHVEQALRADEKLWLRIAIFCRHGVIRDRDGLLPAEAGFNATLNEPFLLLMLCPLLSAASESFSNTARPGVQSGGTNDNELSKLGRKLDTAEQKKGWRCER